MRPGLSYRKKTQKKSWSKIPNLLKLYIYIYIYIYKDQIWIQKLNEMKCWGMKLKNKSRKWLIIIKKKNRDQIGYKD